MLFLDFNHQSMHFGVCAGLVAEDVAFSDAVVECTGVAAWLQYAQVRTIYFHTY